MRKILLFVFLISALRFSAFAQIIYQKINTTATGYSGIITSDGGYVVAGISNCGSGNSAYIEKFDSTGNTLWSKSFGDIAQDDGAFSVCQTTDSGYVLAGTTLSFGAGHKDIYVVKTDGNGDTLWTRAFGTPDYEEAHSVAATFDGGCIVFGTWWSIPLTENDLFVMKLNSNGDTLWTRHIDGSSWEQGWCISQTADSGYIMTGMSGPETDVCLIKLDLNANLLWSKYYGSPVVSDFGTFVRQTSDGGYIVTGMQYDTVAGSENVYLLKTDGNGDTLWTRCYGGPQDDEGTSCEQTSDGGYIIVGFTSSFGAGRKDIYLIKTDSNGNLLWSKTYGGSADDGFYNRVSVQQAADGGYLITTFTGSFGIECGYLLKTDANGNSGCNEGNPATVQSIPRVQMGSGTYLYRAHLTVTHPATSIYCGGTISNLCISTSIPKNNISDMFSLFPSPASNQFTISGAQSTDGEIDIYNSTGEKIYADLYCGQKTVDCALFSSGIYFVKITTEKGSTVKKLVVEGN